MPTSRGDEHSGDVASRRVVARSDRPVPLPLLDRERVDRGGEHQREQRDRSAGPRSERRGDDAGPPAGARPAAIVVDGRPAPRPGRRGRTDPRSVPALGEGRSGRLQRDEERHRRRRRDHPRARRCTGARLPDRPVREDRSVAGHHLRRAGDRGRRLRHDRRREEGRRAHEPGLVPPRGRLGRHRALALARRRDRRTGRRGARDQDAPGRRRHAERAALSRPWTRTSGVRRGRT